MEQSIKNQLEELLGVPVNYKNQNLEVKDFKEVNGKIVVITSFRTFNFLPSEIQTEFFDLLKNTTSVVQNKSNVVAQTFVAPEENASIKSALLEVLNKVKTDSSYVPQVKAVCQITDAMVKVHKAEMEMYKIQKS
ncbi:MAG TPA: hypothetical protein DCF99_06075 [Flavobacteriaceae bacterium]|nr:hypothetical protein [Flavobacteriaceae bacterium]